MTATATQMAVNGQRAVAQEATAHVAARFGEDASAINMVDEQWAGYVSQGVHIVLHVGGWMATTTVQPEDVGLVPKDDAERETWAETLTLGELLQLPKDTWTEIARLRSAIRHALYDARFEVFGLHFVSDQRYPAWKQKTTDLANEYRNRWTDVLDNWQQMMSQVRISYGSIAIGNYDRLLRAGVTMAWKKPLGTEQEYVQEFVQRMMQRVPEKAYVERLVRCEWHIYYLPLAQMLTQEVAEEVEAARLEAMSEMQRDLAAQRRDRDAIQRELADFAKQMQGSLRETLYESTRTALETLQGHKGKPLANGTSRVPLTRLRTLVGWVDEMKYWPDDELDAQLNRLRPLLDVERSKDADAQGIQEVVHEIAVQSRLLLAEIDWPDVKSGHKVGIPDDVVELEAIARRGRPAQAGFADDDEGLPATPTRRRSGAAA